MQELRDEISQVFHDNQILLKIDISKYLEKEKEQILRAFELGMHECLAYDANSIKYYNQTYKPETNVGNDGFEFDNSSTIPPPKTNNLNP